MTKKETLKRALKELVEARHNLRDGLKNGVPPAQEESALWEKVEYRTHSNFSPVNFCHECGRPLTDEAVQMVMERMEALKDGKAD